MTNRAHIVVSEILGSGLLNEGVRPTICDAKTRLATRDAVFIPAGAQLMGQLVESSELRGQSVVGKVLGFDLSVLTDLQVTWGKDMHSVRHRALSPVVQLTRFDFTRCESGGVDRFRIPISASGRVDAVAFWYQIVLDESTSISTGVGAGDTHVGQWGQQIRFMDRETNVIRGQEGEVVVHHGDTDVDMWYTHGGDPASSE